jgi:hypothetical protein
MVYRGTGGAAGQVAIALGVQLDVRLMKVKGSSAYTFDFLRRHAMHAVLTQRLLDAEPLSVFID